MTENEYARRGLYESAKADGWDVGDYDTFSSWLKTPAPQPKKVVAPKNNLVEIAEEKVVAPTPATSRPVGLQMVEQEIATNYDAYKPQREQYMEAERKKEEQGWTSYAGDLAENLAAGGLNFLSGAANLSDKIVKNKDRVLDALSIPTLPTSVTEAVTTSLLTPMGLTPILSTATYLKENKDAIKAAADDMSKKAVRYRDEQGNQKDFTQLWKEGDYTGAVGDIFLQATQSLPVSLMAAGTGGLGLAAIGAVGASEKYDELNDNNPDIGETAKVLNAVLTGVSEAASESVSSILGSKVIMPIIRQFGKPAGSVVIKRGLEDAVTAFAQKYGLAIAPFAEGVEEWANQIAQNTIDKVSGVDPDRDVTEGALQAFVYGAAGGAQFSALGGALKGADAIARNVNKRAIRKAYEEASSLLTEEERNMINKDIASVISFTQKYPEKANAANQYFQAKAAYDRLINVAKEDIAIQTAQEENRIDNVTHTDGNVYAVTIPDGSEANIVDGPISIDADGNISGERVIIVDSEGKKKMMPTTGMKSVSVVSANDAKSNAANNIRNQVATAVEQEMTTPDAAEQAQDIDAQISALQQRGSFDINANGKVNKARIISVGDNGVQLAIKNGKEEVIHTFSPAEVVQLVLPEPSMAQTQATPTPKYGERVSVDGVSGTVIEEADNDGYVTIETDEPINGKHVMREKAENLTLPVKVATENIEGAQPTEVVEEEAVVPDFREIGAQATAEFLAKDDDLDTADFIADNIKAAEKNATAAQKKVSSTIDYAERKEAYKEKKAADETLKFWQDVQAAFNAPVVEESVATEEVTPVVEEVVEETITPEEATTPKEDVASVEPIEEVAVEEATPEVAEVVEEAVVQPQVEVSIPEPLIQRVQEWEKATGVQVVPVKTIDEVTNPQAKRALKQGKRVTGWFDTKENKVYLYYPNLQSVDEIDATYVHEVVAHKGIKALFKDDFDALCDKVWEMMSPAARKKYLGRVSHLEVDDQARQRAAADEYMAYLSEKVSLNTKEKTIWQNIIDAVRELLQGKFSTSQYLSKENLTDKDLANIIKESFRAMRKQAASNTEDKGAVIVNDTMISNDAGQALFSISTYEDRGREALMSFVNKQVSANVLTEAEGDIIIAEMERIYNTCKEYIGEYEPFAEWSNATVAVDVNGKPVFSVIKKNGDYVMNLDFSLLCKKRRTLDAVFEEMINRNVINDYDLRDEDIAKINAVIREFGFETACRLCFVDARRFRIAKVADDFCAMFNELSLMSEEDLRGEANLSQKTSKLTVREKTARHLLAHPEDKALVDRRDFITAKGFDNMKMLRDDVLKLYNMKKGTGGPKPSSSDVQYLNDIQSRNRWTPEAAYQVGGVRLQSFSDYVPRLVFDYIQMIADLAAKKIPVHAYTKEPIFAKQFGLTGMKINMSRRWRYCCRSR